MRGELLHGGAPIGLARDVVPLEDFPRTVACEFHGHAFGDPSAHQVPDGRPPEVMREAAEQLRALKDRDRRRVRAGLSRAACGRRCYGMEIRVIVMGYVATVPPEAPTESVPTTLVSLD
jgi:hypothetical protein